MIPKHGRTSAPPKAIVSTALAGMLAFAATHQAASAPQSGEAADAAQEASRRELGAMLFAEQLFTNPAADYQASCAGCHSTGEDLEGRARRVYADYTAQSLTAGREKTARNTQTLLDAYRAERYGWMGQWPSIEDAIREKMLGEINGWSEADRERAVAAIQFTLLEEGDGGGTGPSYVDRFRSAWDIDLESLPAEGAIEAAIGALASYVSSLSSSHTSRWDAFVEQNRLRPAPNEHETPDDYAFGLESRIGNQEGRGLIRRPEGFSRDAYEGFKVFFRVFGEEDQAVGNCVTCHVTPHFTDYALHEVGASEPLKTPTLRNLSGTDPYLHDGSAATLEDVIREKIELSKRAQSGELPDADPELLDLRLSEADVAPLAAFLRQLDDVGEERFRYFLIHFEND